KSGETACSYIPRRRCGGLPAPPPCRSMRVRRPGRREGGPRRQMPIAPVPCPVRPYSSLFSVARFRSVSDHSPTVTNPAQSPAVNLLHQEDRAGGGEGRRPLPQAAGSQQALVGNHQCHAVVLRRDLCEGPLDPAQPTAAANWYSTVGLPWVANEIGTPR